MSDQNIPSGETGELPGFERPKIDALEQLCRELNDLEDQRSEVSENITLKRKQITTELVKHEELASPPDDLGTKKYAYRYARNGKPRIVEVSFDGKVSTREAKAKDAEDGADAAPAAAPASSANGKAKAKPKGGKKRKAKAPRPKVAKPPGKKPKPGAN